ncbi:hypothetical protein BGX38DRAFT_280931 [Terfezia claveryi]|nr:hypothetical protein BGX38DRAFT_280931 [Terfezia claveryi]
MIRVRISPVFRSTPSPTEPVPAPTQCLHTNNARISLHKIRYLTPLPLLFYSILAGTAPSTLTGLEDFHGRILYKIHRGVVASI